MARLASKGSLLPLGLPVVLGCVVGQAVQDEDLAPLGALVQGCQQLVNGLRVQIKQVAAGVRFGDLREGSHCVCHHLVERVEVTEAGMLLSGQGGSEANDVGQSELKHPERNMT